MERPATGWLSVFRQAQGMSVSDLAKRAGLSRSRVSEAQKYEAEGRVTLNTLERIADAMGGKLVYAVVPKNGTIEDMVHEQARKKARRIVKRARAHMALEQQTEGLPLEEEEIEALASDMIRGMKRDFWS